MQLFLRRQIEEALKTKLGRQRPDTAVQIWMDEDGRLRVTELSILADIIQKDDVGRPVNQRALLTHVQDKLSFFSQDQIDELQDLIRSTKSKEADYQKFLERNPRLLAHVFNLEEVHPHVFLANSADSDLIPDFILTDVALQRAAVIDLKLPQKHITRRQTNRDRFSSAIAEARAQLLTYRDWFRSDTNRKSLKHKVGMEIYEPKMGVIIGRSAEFLGEFDRQRLVANTSDIEIVTFDDLATLAKRRKLIIEAS